MTFIIGDIHGEISKLIKLINNILLFDHKADFVFIGDYLDKGENPYQTLIYLSELELNHSCVFLWGNHEYLWMNLFEGDKKTESYLWKYGGKSTIESFNAKSFIEAKHKISERFSTFMMRLKPYWNNDSHLVVHSGIHPEDFCKNIADIPLERLLFNRYDFLLQQEKYMKTYTVIFGHTGFYTPFVDPCKIGIDTAACFLEYQPLTAFCPEFELFIDSNNNQYALNNLETNTCPVIPRNKPWRTL